MRQTPYTDSLGSGRTKMIEGSEGYWGKFPDVFDASFRESLRRGMEGKKGKSANDPWCIGYFSDNEMSWGDELSLGMAALKSPREQAAKQAFSAQLRARYADISKLNEAWGTAHESWDALLECAQSSGVRGQQAGPESILHKSRGTIFSDRARGHQGSGAQPALSRVPVCVGEPAGCRCGGEVLRRGELQSLPEKCRRF